MNIETAYKNHSQIFKYFVHVLIHYILVYLQVRKLLASFKCWCSVIISFCGHTNYSCWWDSSTAWEFFKLFCKKINFIVICKLLVVRIIKILCNSTSSNITITFRGNLNICAANRTKIQCFLYHKVHQNWSPMYSPKHIIYGPLYILRYNMCNGS